MFELVRRLAMSLDAQDQLRLVVAITEGLRDRLGETQPQQYGEYIERLRIFLSESRPGAPRRAPRASSA